MRAMSSQIERLVSDLVAEVFDGDASAMPRVREAVERAIALERERCVAVCQSRMTLWRNTPLASSEIASARDEARARANEAAYIADVLRDPPVETANEEPAN